MASRVPPARRAARSWAAGRSTRSDRHVPSAATGGEDRVQAHPDVGEPAVDARARVVEAAAGRQREPLGQPPHRRLVGEAHGRSLQPRAPVHPDRAATADEDVRGARIAQQLVERTGADELLPEHPQRGEDVEVGRHPAGLRADGGRDGRRRGLAACGGEPGAHPLDEQRVHTGAAARASRRPGAGRPWPAGSRRPPRGRVAAPSSTVAAASASGPRARPGASPRSNARRQPPLARASPRPAAAPAPWRPRPGRCRPVRARARPARRTARRARPRPPPPAPRRRRTARPPAPPGR